MPLHIPAATKSLKTNKNPEKSEGYTKVKASYDLV
jgi:hypothetical protein